MSAITELPVFGLALTLSVYLLSALLYQRLGRPGLLSPVLVTVIGVALVLEVTGLPYAVYMQQVTVLTLLLGPATLALALPLLRNGRPLLSSAPAVLVPLVSGLACAAGEHMLPAALARSVTSSVGLSIADTLGASVPLAVVLTLFSGSLGAVVGPALPNLARVRDERARGFAIGLTSHGIGTSRALAESPVTGGWSSAGMVLNALAMTLVLPLVAYLVTGGPADRRPGLTLARPRPPGTLARPAALARPRPSGTLAGPVTDARRALTHVAVCSPLVGKMP